MNIMPILNHYADIRWYIQKRENIRKKRDFHDWGAVVKNE